MGDVLRHAATGDEQRSPAARMSQYETAERLQTLFRKYWPDRQPYEHPPDITACAFLATTIEIVREHTAQDRKKPRRPHPILGVEGKKYARLFLRHLQCAQKNLEDQLRVFGVNPEDALEPPMQKFFSESRGMLAEVTAANDHVTAFTRVCAEFDKRNTESARRNPAVFIVERLRLVWREGNFPDAKGRDSPLCGFVQEALTFANIHYSEDHVSDMLRERTQRPRSGKARAQGRKT
jgi:hypothetical protein